MIVYDTTVSERYAQALFGVTKREGQIPVVQADAEQLLLLFERDSKFAVFMEGPQFPTEQKLALLRKSVISQTQPVLGKLLELLLLKGRIEYVRPIMTRYIELAEADQGIFEAQVTTAQELDENQKSRLQTGLEKFVKSRLRLRYRVEPAVVGGVRFAMGDLLVDDTIKGKLDRLRHVLQEAARV